MSLPDGITVRGFLADGDTGAGLGGLRVELWSTNGGGPSLAAVSQSDDVGRFRFRLAPERLIDARHGGSVDVELRVLDGGKQILSEVRALSVDGGSENIELSVPQYWSAREGTSDEQEITDRCEVGGQVKGSLPEGATVRAVLSTLREGVLAEQVVAETIVSSDGWYRMSYECPARSTESSDTSLTVRLYAPSGELIAESTPVLSPARRTRVDLRPLRASPGPSEYALLERHIAAELETGAEALAGAEASVIEEVSDWLDVDSERLMLFQQARALESDTGLPASMFYALGRGGAGLTLEELVDVPIHGLRTAVEEAAADGIVDAELLENLDSHVEQLARHVVERATCPDRQPLQYGVAEILEAADIPPRTIAHVLRTYQARSGEASEFWESLGETIEAEGVDDGVAREIEVAVQLGEVLGPDPALLRRMHEIRHEGRWQAPKDLARFSFDDWCDLIEELETAEQPAESVEGEDATIETEEEVQDRIEARAEAILDTLEETFPNEFIHERLAEAEELSPGARQLLGRTRDHDFLRGSIRDRVISQPNLLEGLPAEEAEAAVEEVEAVERVSRVADRADEVALLVGTGMGSALDIASTPQRHFIDVYGEALGGRAQAARIHAQAQQTAAGTKLAALRLLQAVQHMPFVLGGPRPEIKGVPDARTLFQAAGGFCDCEHCGSVYSPAAYFVDLLRYLSVSSPERLERLQKSKHIAAAILEKLSRFQPLDVLLGRRPDLADLPLTCENTLTALPYIDLVNELLEARITGGSAAHDTGKTPADVLRAVPQNTSREAYLQLQQAVHPLSLPYHQPLSLSRAYLAHLGVTRLELMTTLGRGESLREALVAEALGMSPEEFLVVARPPADLWRHFGFTAESHSGVPFVQALSHVPLFLDATGITFQSLIDLVSTRFVNADNQLQLETPAADCNPDIIRIAGLDEARLSRMVRLIRLQRRLGWSFAVLDRALVAFGARDLDVDVLEKLAAARELAGRLDRPLVELLVLWSPLDAWGQDNQFDRLFTTRAVMWRTQDEKTFQLRPDRLELAETSDSVDGVASALLAGFRITSEELALIRGLQARRGAAPRLDIAGLSAIYRVVVLARALQLRIAGLDLLLRLIPPEADPFSPGDPAATRRFADIVREVQASDFTPERLAYLFRHESDPRRDPAPLPAQVEAVLGSIRRGLADAFGETSHPAEVSGETLRQKLALLLDPALLDPALEALNPRTSATPAARREFFDRHLARIFADPAAAAARLFGGPLIGPAPASSSAPASSPATALPPSPLTEAPPDMPSVTSPGTPSAPAVPGATPGTTPAAPADGLETRWRANIDFVLEYLLPQLRTRQLRGAVVQTLSDTLGLSIPSTARLLDTVLRSRDRQGEPLLRDFLSLLGTGLTGAYYANPELRGEPTLVRTDPELTFSWGGAAPAPGVPGREFGVRWTGRLAARSKATHTFYVQTDGAVRLSMNVDGTERVLIDQPTASGRVAEHVSQPIALDPRQLTEIRLEYRNRGAPAALSVQFGTGPGAKQPVPTPTLYPADGLTSFAPVEQSYRRLHKAALILTGFGVSDAQLEWLSGEPPFLNLDALPMEAGAGTDAVALFRRWRQLAGLYALRKKLPRSNVDLFEVFQAETLPMAIDRLVLATGWDRSVVEAFVGPKGLAIDSPAGLRPAPEQGDEPMLLRLARAIEVQRRVGVAPATLHVWANGIPDADGAAAIVQAVKARYDEARWLEVARALNDPLRAERRDALVAHLLPRMRDLGIKNRNQLFEYFLIDVDMNPCMLTSRIRQAIGAVQTFFQRCLMNLEPKVSPRIIDDNDWKWLKSYRVWEANRKVFLYPENWIEPELRDDKSPLFQVLERTILQQEIKNDNVEAAFADYLEGLDEISRLDVRGVWFEERPKHRMVARPKPKVLRVPQAPWSEWDNGTYHIFARTFNAPYIWYYRRLENGRNWTAWEKIDADIEGEHLVPVIFQRRMHLFWTLFREVSKKVPKLERKTNGSPPTAGKDWEIQLAYSVYDRGRWSRKRMSTGSVIDEGAIIRMPGLEAVTSRIGRRDLAAVHLGSRELSPTDYTLRATVTDRGGLPQLQLHLYCRAPNRIQASWELAPAQVELVARFELNGCNGALVPDRKRWIRRAVVHQAARQRRGRRGAVHAAIGNVRSHSTSHPFRVADGGFVNAPTGYQVSGMGFAVSSRRGGALLALPAADARGVTVALAAPLDARRGAHIIPVTNPSKPELRGLYPFFFQDRFRSYFVRPIYADWRPPTAVAVPVLAGRVAPARALPPPRRSAPPP